MTSSGIKRGLASTAIAALAVTGLPFLASSASAAANDTMSVLSQGPIRNTNAAGGTIVLKSTSDDLVASTGATNNLLVTAADYTNPTRFDIAVAPGNSASTPEQSSAAFDVNVISVTPVDGATGGTAFDPFPDGSFHYNVVTAVTLGTATKATFGLVEDVAKDGVVSASDPKTTVEVTPTGAPTQVDISTTAPGGAVGVPVPFSVQAKDTAGNLTQLIGGETFNLSGTDLAFANATAPGTPITSLGASALGADGKATLLVTPSASGTKTATIAGSGTGTPAIAASVTDSQSFSVLAQADIATGEFKFDTGADTWVDGTTAFGTGFSVRVDQTSATISFASKDGGDSDSIPDDANTVVLLSLDNDGTATGVRFNGKDPSAEATGAVLVPVVLDAEGKGTTTIALSNVVENSTWTFAATGSNIASTQVTMARPVAGVGTVKPDSTTYVTKIGSPTSVVVTGKDQFGNPITGTTQVAVSRTGRTGNVGDTARVTVNSSGQATFSLPDAGTGAGTETLGFKVYDDQFDTSALTATATSTINYTADGLGAAITLSPATSAIAPVYDATVPATGSAGDSQEFTIGGGTDGVATTVTVDNGASILNTGETTLDKGASSDTVTLTSGVDTFRVVGTKAGTVNVTVTGGGRTATSTMTVTAATGTANARNVSITGPDHANAGTVAPFVVKVTDAFGNPIAGVGLGNLAITTAAPATFRAPTP